MSSTLWSTNIPNTTDQSYMTYLNGYLFVSVRGTLGTNNGFVARVSMSNPSTYTTILSGLANPTGIDNDGTYFYLSLYNSNLIQKYDINGNLQSWSSTVSNPEGAVINGNYLYTSGTSFPLNTDSALVLYYPFDGDILDYATGSGVSDATIVGSATISNSFYKVGSGSLYQNTTNGSSYLKIANIPANTGGYTISFWFYMTGTSQGMIFGFANSGGDRLGVWFGNNYIRFFTSTDYALFAPSLNTWYHLVWTLDTSNLSNFYINGSPYPTTTTLIYTNAAFNTGLNYIFNSTSLNSGIQGYVDDFRYYNRVLTSTEVSLLYIAFLYNYIGVTNYTPVTIQNYNFQTPTVTSSVYQNPISITGWTVVPCYAVTIGNVTANSGFFPTSNSNFPYGVNQIISIQSAAGTPPYGGTNNFGTGYVTQNLTFSTGKYSLSFYTSARATYYNSQNTLSVSVNGNYLLTNYVPSTANWARMDLSFAIATSGSYPLTFYIINNPTGGYDSTINFSNVMVNYITSNNASNKIQQVNLSTGAIANSSWATNPFSNTYPIPGCINNNYMYTFAPTTKSVYKIPLVAGSPPTSGTAVLMNTTFANTPTTIIPYNNTVLIADASNNIYQFNASDNLLKTFPASSATYSGNGMSVISNDLYSLQGGNIYDYVSVSPDLTCFLEGTQILTDKGYRPIQNLRKGDLVKTCLNGFLPIAMMGKKEIVHLASQERIKEQLYQCSTAQYPELTEDLVITGCHSILIDEFQDEKQRAKTLELMGDIFITEDQYRLPACLDDRASVYPTPGSYMIYHLALMNNSWYANYGIYANGLLVESCSKRYLQRYSGMDLF